MNGPQSTGTGTTIPPDSTFWTTSVQMRVKVKITTRNMWSTAQNRTVGKGRCHPTNAHSLFLLREFQRKRQLYHCKGSAGLPRITLGAAIGVHCGKYLSTFDLDQTHVCVSGAGRKAGSVTPRRCFVPLSWQHCNTDPLNLKRASRSEWQTLASEVTLRDSEEGPMSDSMTHGTTGQIDQPRPVF